MTREEAIEIALKAAKQDKLRVSPTRKPWAKRLEDREGWLVTVPLDLDGVEPDVQRIEIHEPEGTIVFRTMF